MRKAGASSRLTTLIVVFIVASTFVAGIITRAQRDVGPVDLIVLNGKVYAGGGRTAEAVAVQGNKIVSVGSNRDVKRLRRPQTTVVDAHGGTVLPGFNDAYVRIVEGGATRRGLNLAGAATVEDVATRLKDYADQHDDEWIAGHGWDAAAIGPAAPMRAALDAAVPDRPVFLTSSDGQMAWVNSEALDRAQITRATPGPGTGTIVRTRRGEPSGLLRDAALDLVRHALPSRTLEDQIASLRAGIEEAHRLGVTSVQNAGDASGDLAALDALRSAGELKLRVYQALEVPAQPTDADLAQLDETRKEYGDDPVLKTGAAEIATDGLTRESLSRLVGTLDRRGWQVWIRAESTQVVQWALSAFQAAAHENPGAAEKNRHRIDYAAAVSPEDAARFARLGVIAAAPSSAVAEELAEENGRVALGSGWPFAPLDPREAIRGVLAPSTEGPELPQSRAFSLKDAIDAYTSAGAHASFDEQRKGTLAPGMLADIVILSADIFETPLERLMDVSVDMTIFDGAVVYTRAD